MRTFKTKEFARFAKSEGIDDATLCRAVGRAQSGLVDADLGGGVLKLRIARKGGGRSGGYRTIVLFRRGELAFFVQGFAKSSQANLGPRELRRCRRLAADLLPLDNSGLALLLAAGTIIEVKADE